jgi:hypothetical protein
VTGVGFLCSNLTIRNFCPSPVRNLYSLTVTEDQLLSKNWELETSGYVPDNRFKKTFQFYPPISARLGVRFSF